MHGVAYEESDQTRKTPADLAQRLSRKNSNFYHATNQYNTIINSPPPEQPSLRRFNDAPTGLLTSQFTGRQKELDFLREVFSTAPNAVPIRCVLCGMPGIGKTNLVLRYVVDAFDQGYYSQVLWSSGTTVDKLGEGMVKILDLVGHPERHRPEQGAKLTAARRWLEDPQGGDNIRWLLVIDNVDRKVLGFLREHLPRTNAQGHILFTTRTVDVADALVDVTGAPHRKLIISVPDMRDTTRLLLSSAGIEIDTVTSAEIRNAEKLVEAVGSLPLAIAHAASYMKQTQTSLEDMLELYEGEYKGEMLEWENDLTSYQEQSVTATFEALFAELDQNSSRFLKLLSFLDPERIPLKLLVEGAKGLSQKGGPPTAISSRPTNDPATDTKNTAFISPDFRPLLTLILSPIQRKATVQKLQRLSLVEQLFDDDQSYLRMHDLVQYIMGERAKKEADMYREWLRSTVSLVCRAFRTVEEPQLPQWWPECEMLMPHLHSLNQRWSHVGGVNLELAKADPEMARYLISQGRYGEAEAMCQRSVESFEEACGTEHPDTLDAVHALAYTYFRQERYPDAQAAGERVLAEQLKTLGADHAETADSMNTLAVVYSRQGRYNKAEELLEGALAGFKKNHGPEHRYTFTAMNNLGEVYMHQERFDEAEQLLQRTLAFREKIFGRNHIDTMVTVQFLARVYESQKRCVEAEELLKRALLAREKQLGYTHPRTLETVFSLARLYQSQSRYDKAEENFKRAFTGRMQELGANHPGTSRAANALAESYRSQERDSEADAVLNSLRDGQEQMVNAPASNYHPSHILVS